MPLQIIASRGFGKPSSPFGGEEKKDEPEMDAKAEAADILGLDKTKAKALEVFINACKGGSAFEEE